MRAAKEGVLIPEYNPTRMSIFIYLIGWRWCIYEILWHLDFHIFRFFGHFLVGVFELQQTDPNVITEEERAVMCYIDVLVFSTRATGPFNRMSGGREWGGCRMQRRTVHISNSRLSNSQIRETYQSLIWQFGPVLSRDECARQQDLQQQVL